MQILNGNEVLDKFGVAYFQGASLMGALTPEVIEYLLKQGKVYTVKKGDLLFKAGDKGNSFLIILDGVVSTYQYHHGEYAYIRDHQFGEEVGFVAMIALHERACKAVAAEDSCVLEISSSLFSQLHKEYPEEFGVLLLNLAREMARTIRSISNTIVNHKIAQDQSYNQSGS